MDPVVIRLLISMTCGVILAWTYRYLIESVSRAQPLLTAFKTCPHCGAEQSFLHSVPILGHLSTSRCPQCNTSFSLLPMAGDLIISSFTIYAMMRMGPTEGLHLALIFGALWGIVVLEVKRWMIPNQFVLVILVLGIISYLPSLAYDQILYALLVGVSVSFLLILPQLGRLKEGRIGMGDMKLVLAVSIWLGWVLAIYALFIATLLALVFWMLQGFLSGFDLDRKVRFGPFVAVTGLILGMAQAMDPAFASHLLSFRF